MMTHPPRRAAGPSQSGALAESLNDAKSQIVVIRSLAMSAALAGPLHRTEEEKIQALQAAVSVICDRAEHLEDLFDAIAEEVQDSDMP